MPSHQSPQSFNWGRKIKQFLLSGFVVFTFVAYAIDQSITHANRQPPVIQPTLIVESSTIATSTTIPATATFNPGEYRDGTYTGPAVDAYYGMVQMQATVQNGKIVDVQFLQYPNDRRTSRQINSFAMPYLQQEAIQAQSAHVNIISGATFTSQGFAISLNEALKTAKN